MKNQDVQKKYLYIRTTEKMPPLKKNNHTNIKIICVSPSEKRLNSYDKVEPYSKLWYSKHNICAVDTDCQLGAKCPMSIDLIKCRETLSKPDYFKIGYDWYEDGCVDDN
jgi:hypothetical protein